MDCKIELAKAIAQRVDLPIGEIVTALETPPNPEMGDYAFPCFRLSKMMRKAPAAIASELAESIEKPALVREIKTAGAYLNFYLENGVFAKGVLSEVLAQKEDFGKSTMGNGKNIVLDFSSPNIAKPFHIGHLRSTVIGNALRNIYSCLGYHCVAINHLGDWGTQFGKLIVAYRNWGDDAAIEKNGITELTRIYVLFHDEADKNPALNDEARHWLLKMQEGDEEALRLWKWFNDISLQDFNRIYDMLNIQFDHYTGESFYNDKMQPVVEELKQKSLLQESEGAMVVDLEEYKMPPCLILRSDGGTLYPTRDIAAAIYRKETYHFEKALYLTAFDQNLHFQQWFKVIERLGYDWAKDLVHVPFGLVAFEGGKLATRKGHVLLMEDLLKEAIAKTKEIIQEKNPDLDNKDEVAKQVGIGAILFNDLYNNRIKDFDFSWDRALNFDGETGPYVQYTHARACSLLEKSGVQSFDNIDYSLITDEASINVVKLVNLYPDKIAEAASRNEPYLVSRHLMELAQAFSKFYNTNHILNSQDDVKLARLSLVYAVKTILASGLALLGLAAPNKM